LRQKLLLFRAAGSGNGPDRVADFAVAGQVVRWNLAGNQPPGGLHFRRPILGLFVSEQQLSGLERHAATQSIGGHVFLKALSERSFYAVSAMAGG
jgi:hypothetical protein